MKDLLVIDIFVFAKKGAWKAMSRIIDEAYFKYSVYSAMESGMQVKCPKCLGIGMIVADDDNVHFKCTSCGHQKAMIAQFTATMLITNA